MSFTQIERNIIKVLGDKGPMGVTTLMPQVEGLEGKAQLINVLESLAKLGVTKKQSNSQWAVLKSVLSELKKNGELVKTAETKSTQKSTKPASDILKDIPSTQDIRTPAKPAKHCPTKEAKKYSSTDMVRELMTKLPTGASLGITADGITLFWNQVTFEPSTEELDDVMQSINCLQKHVA